MRVPVVFVLVSLLFAGPLDSGDRASPVCTPEARSREEVEEELEEFVPSVELPADSTISFPVDI